MAKRQFTIEKEYIHEYFGLSYANYLVLPRVVLQSMPDEWQEHFVGLLNQIPELFGTEFESDGGYDVRAKDLEGRFITDSYSNYERGRRRLTEVTKEQRDQNDKNSR